MNAIENVKGPVLRPGDDGFDEQLAGCQEAHPHRPDLVVGAETAEDVQTAVRHAADHGLAVAVQTSGHGRAEPLSGGVLISTRRMDGVRIDPATRVARVEAGTRWAQAGVVGYRISGLRSSRATRLETGSPGSRARECAPSAILG